MSDLMLNLNKTDPAYGDLLVQKGDLVMTPDQETGIRQHILQRLRTYLGEWFMDLSIGIDYFGQILTKNPDQSTIDAIFISIILGTPGVAELSAYSFQSDFTTRTASVSFTVQTTQGTVSYEGILSTWA